MRSWCLVFEADPDRRLVFSAVVAAVEAGLGVPVAVRWSGWEGNPHDGFARHATGTAEIPTSSGVLRVAARLGREHARLPGSAAQLDVAALQVTLSGGDVPVMSRLWERLAGALGALGLSDQTLAEVPADIVDALEESGEVARAAAMRREITRALCAKLAAAPDHWPVVVSFTRPHDMGPVLRAAPCPARVKTIVLRDCGLARLPAVLLEEPVRFAALEHLDLSRNPLRTLPPLATRYPALRTLTVVGCPALVLAEAGWAGVKVVRRAPRVRLS